MHTNVKFEHDFQKRVLQLCIIANKSPRQLCIAAGVSEDIISNVLHKNTRPIRRTLHRLCKAADVDLKQFLEVDKYELRDCEQRYHRESSKTMARTSGRF